MLQTFKTLIFILVLSAPMAAFAQGSISGNVKDETTGEAIIGANVIIQGTQIGSPTDIEGNFIINNVKPGTYTLQISFITYKTQVLTNVIVESGKKTAIDIKLAEEAQQLEEVVVKGQSDKTSEYALLSDRKKSIEIVQSIGAQELSRKGVGDAEAAVTQITGVSKQQGVKNVFVRGLGDRYNSTSLNNLPLPSEDPAYKNISLSFFSTGIIDNIGVNKTFSSNIYGDVAGANINIVSKKLFGEQEFSISGSIGANSLVLSHDFYRADGNNFMGTVDKQIPVTNLGQYTFKNSFSPNQLSGTSLNPSLALSGGKSFDIGNNTLKLFLVASMSSDYLYKEGNVSQTNTVGDFRQDLKLKKYEYTATQFAMGNVSYEFANGNIGYNMVLVHDNKQSVANYHGYSQSAIDDITAPNAYDALIIRQQTNNNVLLVNQLTGEFNLSKKLFLDVRGSFNTIRGDEPDRRTNFLIGDGNEENYAPNNNSPAYNHRFFSTLKENDFAANAGLTYKLKGDATKISVGYNVRNTSRDFDYVQFNFDHQTAVTIDPNNPDAFYNQQSLDNSEFELETSRGSILNPNALDPFFYTGDRTIHAGFVNFVYEINPSLSLVAGTRFESFEQKIVWSVGADEIRLNIPGDNTSIRNKSYFLPSLNVKYTLSESDQLRLSFSKTYTSPQFKEVAPFLYEDVNENIFGNPDLTPSENLNVDLKYEHYFEGDGLIAVTGFYKFIKGSINKVLASSAALEMSYFNTGNANVVGGELEFRRKLFDLSRSNQNTFLSSGVNVSYLYATQELINDPTSGVQFTPTDKRSGLEGASPVLVNADLTFTKLGDREKKITSALVLNYFSKRIYSLGVSGQNNVYERGVPTLDLITKVDLSTRFTLSLSFRNLLNPEYRLTKEILNTGKDDILAVYQRGITSSIGFSYKF